MQLLGQQMCEYQTNCWSCRTVSQTAQHCESSIAVKITAGKPGDGGDRYHVKRTLDFPFLSFLFSISAKPKRNSWIYKLKPYNSSKTKQRASLGCKWEQNSRLSPVPCMQKLLHLPPPPAPAPARPFSRNKPPSPLEKRSRDWRLQEDLKRTDESRVWNSFDGPTSLRPQSIPLWLDDPPGRRDPPTDLF